MNNFILWVLPHPPSLWLSRYHCSAGRDHRFPPVRTDNCCCRHTQGEGRRRGIQKKGEENESADYYNIWKYKDRLVLHLLHSGSYSFGQSDIKNTSAWLVGTWNYLGETQQLGSGEIYNIAAAVVKPVLVQQPATVGVVALRILSAHDKLSFLSSAISLVCAWLTKEYFKAIKVFVHSSTVVLVISRQTSCGIHSVIYAAHRQHAPPAVISRKEENSRGDACSNEGGFTAGGRCWRGKDPRKTWWRIALRVATTRPLRSRARKNIAQYEWI